MPLVGGYGGLYPIHNLTGYPFGVTVNPIQTMGQIMPTALLLKVSKNQKKIFQPKFLNFVQMC